MLVEKHTDYEVHQGSIEKDGIIYPITVRIWNDGRREAQVTQELLDAGIIKKDETNKAALMMRSAVAANTEDEWVSYSASNTSGFKITISANDGAIAVESNTTGGDYGYDSYYPSDIKIDAKKGVIETRNEKGVAQVSAAGIFCNNASTQAVAASTGISRKAAIVGLGFGYMDKYDWENENFIAGVYGYSSNSGTAPAYGGFFQDLLISGLILKSRSISDSSGTVYLSKSDSFILGLTNSGVTKTLYLPNDGVIGRTILAKQIGQGAIRFYPRSGQYIHDDSSQNDYYDIPEGWLGIFIFTRFALNGVVRDVWTVSMCKFR